MIIMNIACHLKIFIDFIVHSQTIHGHDLNALADRIFKSMDVDHDGEITVAEMDAGSKYIDKDGSYICSF